MKKTIYILGLLFLYAIPAWSQYEIDLSNENLPARIFLYRSAEDSTILIKGLVEDTKYDLILLSSDGEQVPFSAKGLKDLRGHSYVANATQAILYPTCTIWHDGYLSVAPHSNPASSNNRMDGISVSPGPSPSQLIRDVLIGGDCFDVENVTPIGSSAGMGTFTADSAVIGLEEGVILASGDINVALGPNAAPNAGVGIGGGGDPDLNQLTSGTIFDAVGIEFDFTPTSDFVRFRYVFASEEYCEFVGTPFNDVFGFFLSGPGINGPFTNNAVNLATIPGSNTFVAINNVNHNDNAALFYDNTPMNQPQQQNLFNCNYSPGPGSVLDQDGVSVELIEYDGFTAVFEAVLEVVECETYHIKMVVGDVTDGIYDSAVFLEANSFNAGSEAQLDAAIVQTGATAGYEGCEDAYLEVRRLPNSDISQPLEIMLNVNPASTATPGEDLPDIPPSITIPRNQEFVRLPLELFQDDIIEGEESLIIETNFICSCEFPYIELIIRDIPEIEIDVEDVTICREAPGTITAIATGGLPGSSFTYEWDDGFNVPTRPLPNQFTSTLFVTVTDDCDNTASTSVDITVIPFSYAELEGDILLCSPDEAPEIPVYLSGQGPYSFSYAINGEQIDLIDNYTDSVFYIPVTDTGTYTIPFILGQDNCPGESLGQVQVSVPDRSVDIETLHIECHGDTTGAIFLATDGFDGPPSIQWGVGSTNDTLTNLPAGRYGFTISDSSECTLVDTVEITQPESLFGNLRVLDEPTCGNTNGRINVRLGGGTAPYRITWDGLQDTTTLLENIGPGIYTYTVSDSFNCIFRDTISIENTFPRISLDSMAPPSCIADGYISISVSNGLMPIEYEWSNGDRDAFLETTSGGTFRVEVTDSLGCTGVDTFTLEEYLFQPVANAGPEMDFDCTAEPVSLDASSSVISQTTNIYWQGPNVESLSDPENLVTEAVDPGLYILTLTDSLSGCFSMDTVILEQLSTIPNVDIGRPDTLTCNLPEVILDASSSSSGDDFSYIWSTQDGVITGPVDSSTTTIAAAGTYTLTVTYIADLCSRTEAVVVMSDTEAPLADAGQGDTLSCDMDFLSLDASNTPLDGVNLHWEGPNGAPIIGDETPVPQVSVPGPYILSVTDQRNGCTSADTVEVFRDEDLPLAIAGPSMTIDCNNPSVVLDGIGSDNGPDYNITWTTDGGNIIEGDNSLTPTVNAPGNYMLEITDTRNGCMATANVEVRIDTIRPSNAIVEPVELTCLDTIATMVPENPVTDLFYTWTDASGTVINPDGMPEVSVNSPGTYFLEVMDQNTGCTSETNIEIVSNTTVPNADAGPDAVMDCRGNPAILDGSASSQGGNISYVWTRPNGETVMSTDNLVPVFEPGHYILRVTDLTNGCYDTDEVLVIQPEIEGLSIETEHINCLNDGGSVLVTNVEGGAGPYTFTLLQTMEESPDGNFESIGEGTYNIEVEDQLGCTYTRSFEIDSEDPVTVSIQGETDLLWGDPAFLSAVLNKPLEEISTITWEPAEEIDCDFCPDIQFIPNGPTTVTVTVTDDGGCIDIAQIMLTLSLDPRVFIPDAFTPSGDQVNDVWTIYTNASVLEIEEVMVFNRWGGKVYERQAIPPNDPQYGWDGTVKGKKAQTGVYAYWAKLKLIDGSSVFYKGDVHLIR